MKEKLKQAVKEYLKKHPEIEIKQFIRDELAVDVSGALFEPFLWAIYEFGTEIYEMKPDQKEKDPQIERLVHDSKTGGEFYGQITEFYIGEKKELRRVGGDEILERSEAFQRGNKWK